jgi:ubiquinone/menaquinone biosynthesis C-methylase UbiE
MKSPYEENKRDCQYLHGFNEKDLKNFIELAKLSKEMTILDGMCGNGVLSKELAKTNGIFLYLLDNSKFQLSLAKDIKGEKIVGSILKMPFEDEKFDRIFIRSGVPEIPKNEQPNLCREVFRVLKKNGLFLNWMSLMKKDNCDFFREIVKYKDSLAGFEDLVKNRYFITEDEFVENLKNAGFSDINFFNLKINYIFSTKKWYETDFKKDKVKLELLNKYVKKLKLKHPGIIVKDFDDNIEIIIPTLISVAKK